MGKYSAILIIGLAFIYSLFNQSINKATIDAQDEINSYSEHIYVQNLTRSAMAYWIMQVSEDITLRGVFAEQNRYIDGGSDSVWIQSGTNGAIDVIVVAYYDNETYRLQSVLKPLIPSAMNYAMFSDAGLALSGNVDIMDDSNGLNANIHSNDFIDINGNSVDIEGFGNYVTSISASPSSAATNSFSPNSNPSGGPVSQQVASVDLPGFDLTTLAAAATVNSMGPITLSGAVPLGTPDSPLIWYIDGDLTVHCNFTGNGTIIVNGDITFSGNSSVTSLDESSSPVAFYASNDITVAGNHDIEAQLFANGDININGNATIYGSLVSNSTLSVNGNMDLFYRPVDLDMTTTLFVGEGGVRGDKITVVSTYE